VPAKVSEHASSGWGEAPLAARRPRTIAGSAIGGADDRNEGCYGDRPFSSPMPVNRGMKAGGRRSVLCGACRRPDRFLVAENVAPRPDPRCFGALDDLVVGGLRPRPAELRRRSSCAPRGTVCSQSMSVGRAPRSAPCAQMRDLVVSYLVVTLKAAHPAASDVTTNLAAGHRASPPVNARPQDVNLDDSTILHLRRRLRGLLRGRRNVRRAAREHRFGRVPRVTALERDFPAAALSRIGEHDRPPVANVHSIAWARKRTTEADARTDHERSRCHTPDPG
jgi:hypothetical protein